MEAIRVERDRFFLGGCEMALVKLAGRPIDLVARAGREDFLDRPLADKHVFVGPVRDHDRQPSPREVERDFVDFYKALVNTEDLVDVDVLQHGDVE